MLTVTALPTNSESSQVRTADKETERQDFRKALLSSSYGNETLQRAALPSARAFFFFFNSQVLYVSGVLVWFLLGFLYVFLPFNLAVQSAVTGSCLSVALLVQTSHVS